MDFKIIILLFSLSVVLNLCFGSAEGAPDSNSVSEKSAAVSNVTSVQEKKPNNSVFYIPDEISWRSTLMYGSMAVIFLAITGLMAYIAAPLMGFRLCSIIGTCDSSTLYSAGGNLPSFGQTSATYNDLYNSYMYPGYQKRSLNYIGPILKTLSSAYEKYEQNTASPVLQDSNLTPNLKI